MENLRFIQLLIRQLRNQMGADEKALFSEWVALPENQAQARDFEKIWELSGQYKKGYQPDVERGLDRLRSRIRQDREPRHPRPRRQLLYWIGAAAAVLLLIIWQPWQPEPAQPEKLIVVATNDDQQKTIALPDGSTVILGETSELAYRADWTSQKERFVQLSGEAFFDVEQIADRPFRIEAGGTGIRVLGTAFNVRAYDGEPTREVMVESGVVEFFHDDEKRSLTLNKDQKGILELDEGKMYIEKNGGLNARVWQDNRLSFRDTPLREVSRSLEHYFDIRLEIENSAILPCGFTFNNFRADDLEALLETIEIIFEGEVRQSGDRLYRLQGGSCNSQ